MFYISTFLPRINKTAKLKEFTNKDYFSLSKFYFNNDDDGVCSFFDETIYELLINKEIYYEITCIEKLILWLQLYYSCINDTVSIFSNSINDNISMKIVDIIKIIKSLDMHDNLEININDIIITLNYPVKLFASGSDDIFNNIIYNIKSEKKIYYFQDFSLEEKAAFLSSLPVEHFESFINYYKSIINESYDILPQSEKFSLTPIYINTTDGSILAILKILFKSEMHIHLSNSLIFTKHLGGNYDSYYNMTPRDFQGLYKIYESSGKSEKMS